MRTLRIAAITANVLLLSAALVVFGQGLAREHPIEPLLILGFVTATTSLVVLFQSQ